MKKILLFLIICSISSCFISENKSEKLLSEESKTILNKLQDKILHKCLHGRRSFSKF